MKGTAEKKKEASEEDDDEEQAPSTEKMEPKQKIKKVKPEKIKKVKPEKIKPEKVKPEKVKPEKIKPEKIKPKKIKPEKIKPEKVKKIVPPKKAGATDKKVKKEKALPVAATGELPSDNDPTTPGLGGELIPDQIAAIKQILGIRTDEQLEKFKLLFTPEEIARVKEALHDPAKRKKMKKKKNPVGADTGFAKYNGGPQSFVGLDPKKWRLQRFRFDGKSKCEVTGELEEVNAPVKDGLVEFLTSPISYLAMMFQSNMMNFSEDIQKYTLLHRLGSYQYRPQGTMDLDDPDAKGTYTLLLWTYDHLPPFPNNELPMNARDKYTDQMTYMGKQLHSEVNPPVMPGRGMAIGDAPNLCVIRDVDPTDVYQGTVADCWLLGAISALAEFDGAIKRLFRKTKLLHKRPLPGPNMYTITLCDLDTWTPVSYEIDERLPVKSDGSGKLLACRLSGYGELWPALLEKAMAIHCGGWDGIYGGCCTHAWSILTGCKEQYEIERNPKTGKFFCLTKFNPNTKKWEKHYNNNKEDPGNNLWKSHWPEVGGGGKGEITEDDLFERICKWDETNYIMSAATTGSGGVSSVGQDSGLVEDHAYSLVSAYSNVAGTGIGLLNVRNPWGAGEINDGEFDDDGPGWEKYPEIKEELKPEFQDDGAFWITKEEFFRFYQTIYLSASDMTKFVED